MTEKKTKVLAFLCNWCSYAGADQAGGKKLTYSPDVKLVRVMCSGRVDPQFVLSAFRQGADGVLILGCHPGECHYRSGNMKAKRRIQIMQMMLQQFGIDRRRLRLDWVAAGEAERFQTVANEMAETVAELGPLQLRGFVGAEVAS